MKKPPTLPEIRKPWVPIDYVKGSNGKYLLRCYNEKASGVIWTVSKFQYENGMQRRGANLPEGYKVSEVLVLKQGNVLFRGQNRSLPVVLTDLAEKGYRDGLDVFIRSEKGWHEQDVPVNFIAALYGKKKFEIQNYPKPIYGPAMDKPTSRLKYRKLIAHLLELVGASGKTEADLQKYSPDLDILFPSGKWVEILYMARTGGIMDIQIEPEDDPEPLHEPQSAPLPHNLPDSTEDAVAALLAGLPDPSTAKAPLAEPAKEQTQEPTSAPTPLAEPAKEQTQEPTPNPLKTTQNSPNPTPAPYRYDPRKSLLTEDLYYNAGTDDFEIFEIDEEELEKRKQQQEDHLKTVRNIYQLWLSRHMDAMGIRTPPEYGEVERGKTPPNRHWYLKNIEHMNSDQKIGEFFVPFDQFRRHYEIDPATWEERLEYTPDNRWIKGQEPEVCKKEAEERKAAAQERALAKKQEQEAQMERIKRNLAEED